MSELTPHQQRVVVEKRELDEKIEKLSAFLEGDIFKGIDLPEQNRLGVQLMFMKSYSDILAERIDNF